MKTEAQKTIKLETSIPFPGFYESYYDETMDQDLEYHIESLSEEWGIEQEKISNEIFMHTDYSNAQAEIAKLHCETWLDKFQEETGIDASDNKFTALQSPKEYNFATDRIFVEIPFQAIEQAYKQNQDDSFEKLIELIEERFTSRSGFISHYSNNIDEWIEKPLEDWDHNEIETLLLATVALHIDPDNFNDSVIQSVIEYGQDNGVFMPEVDTGKLKEVLTSKN